MTSGGRSSPAEGGGDGFGGGFGGAVLQLLLLVPGHVGSAAARWRPGASALFPAELLRLRGSRRIRQPEPRVCDRRRRERGGVRGQDVRRAWHG